MTRHLSWSYKTIFTAVRYFRIRSYVFPFQFYMGIIFHCSIAHNKYIWILVNYKSTFVILISLLCKKKVMFILFKYERFYQMVSSISTFFHRRWYYMYLHTGEIRYILFNKCNDVILLLSSALERNSWTRLTLAYYSVIIFFFAGRFYSRSNAFKGVEE